jgi:hypothetical protein
MIGPQNIKNANTEMWPIDEVKYLGGKLMITMSGKMPSADG